LKIRGLIWLEDVVEKLEVKHAVQQQEVRDVFANKPLIYMVEKGHRAGENVYAALGQTDSGRYLSVYFVHKRDGRALILSTRDMTSVERRKHEHR